jgi:DNA-binding MurR/RpiR family transcriptional regulator
MSPQLRKAAQFVLDNPREVGVSSIVELAASAGVKPNTLVRMAQAVGYGGYEGFREPFRDAIRSGGQSFPDRARWLQSIARSGRHGRLLTQMASGAMENIEEMFAATTAETIKAAADRIVEARCTYVLGLGISYALAHNFAYLASMALPTVRAVPRDGSLPMDDLVRAGPGDLLLAMTFTPYRSEVVSAVRVAKRAGVSIIALSDSRASPIALEADHVFVIPTATPQFFTSTVAASAFLESLMAFVVADASPDVVASIERFHRLRHESGIYWPEGG